MVLLSPVGCKYENKNKSKQNDAHQQLQQHINGAYSKTISMGCLEMCCGLYRIAYFMSFLFPAEAK